MTELVRLSVSSGIATITLDSPRNRNALSVQLRAELSRHVRRALDDDAVRVLVLGHTGTVFCAGADLTEAADPPPPDPDADFPALLETLWTAPKPVVGRIAGPARAGGLGLVAACDIAVAAESATFAFSEVRIGVVPAVISVPVLPRLAPRAAQELMLTGATIDGRRAAAIGLVTTAVPDDELGAVVARRVEDLLGAAPQALAATKRLLQEHAAATLAIDLEAMGQLSARHFASAEAAEGVAAFRERRRPSWIPQGSPARSDGVLPR